MSIGRGVDPTSWRGSQDDRNAKSGPRASGLIVTIAVAVLGATATLVGAFIEANGNKTQVQPAVPPSSSTTPSSSPPTTKLNTSPTTDPSTVGWTPKSLSVVLTKGPVALSSNPNDTTDVGYDFSNGTISAQNEAYMLEGIDPSRPPSVGKCQDAMEHNQHYSGLGGWNFRGYFCMVTSRGDLVLVLPTPVSNGFIDFHVWMQPK